MVEPRAVLVSVEALAPSGEQILRRSRQVRERDVAQQRKGYRIQAPVWDLIIQKRLTLLAGKIAGIENRGQAGKVALPHRGGRNRKRLCERLPDPLAFITHKQKRSVLP